MQNYEYPIELDWTYDEMDQVIQLWRAVELAYETGINREEFLTRYRGFKEIVPAKGEEKHYAREFEKLSGYSLYHAVKAARDSDKPKIKLEKRR